MRGTLMLLIPAAAAMVSTDADRQGQQMGARPAFEVASIKASKRPGVLMQLQPLPGGRLVAENVPLLYLIMTAHDIPPSRISGGPSFR